MRAFFLILCGLLLSLAGLGSAHAHGSGAHRGAAPALHAPHRVDASELLPAGLSLSVQEDAARNALPGCATLRAMKSIDGSARLSTTSMDCGERIGQCCHSACAVLPAAVLPSFPTDPGHAVPAFFAQSMPPGRFAPLFRPPRAALA